MTSSQASCAISHREKALQSDDPYQYCITHHVLRNKPWEENRVTFYFGDGSELTFDIRYEVRK